MKVSFLDGVDTVAIRPGDILKIKDLAYDNEITATIISLYDGYGLLNLDTFSMVTKDYEDEDFISESMDDLISGMKEDSLQVTGVVAQEKFEIKQIR